MSRHERRASRDEARKEYASPRLCVFGRVQDLTRAAGGSLQAEQNCGLGNADGVTRSGTRICSDRRTKENIVRVGIHWSGVGLYLFDYKKEFQETWGVGRQFGAMADEVEKVIPQAVALHPQGYKVVDYGMLGIHNAGR